MSTIRLERRIAADPTSVALLLVGPAAYPLWPGVVAVDASADGDESAVLRLTLPERSPGDEIAVRVTTRRPQRLPRRRYVLRFTAASAGLSIDGVVTLTYAQPEPDDGPPNATDALLEMTLPEEGSATVSPATMRAMGEDFLARLGHLGEQRAAAA